MLDQLFLTFSQSSNAGCFAVALAVFLIIIAITKLWALGPSCTIQKDLKGKIIFITGGNAGIGKETALGLVGRNATVIMGCRSKKRAEAALSDIRKKEPGANIDFIELDLSNLASVRKCAATFLKKYNRLDILINNAGVMAIPERQLTADGFEMQFGTNHLGHFLLTQLLMEALLRSAPSRVINVSAGAGEGYKMGWGNLQWERNYSAIGAYRQSKLANILHAKELAAKYPASKIKACSLHPGIIPTDLGRHLTKKWYMKVLWCHIYPIFWLVTKSKYTGAQTTIHCAMIDHDQLSNGGYYKDCREKVLNGESVDPLSASRLWSVSEELVGLAGKN